jgi:hypothetical protein
MKEKQAIAKQVRSHYLNVERKEMSAILDESIKITGYKKQKIRLAYPQQSADPPGLARRERQGSQI